MLERGCCNILLNASTLAPSKSLALRAARNCCSADTGTLEMGAAADMLHARVLNCRSRCLESGMDHLGRNAAIMPVPVLLTARYEADVGDSL